MRIVLLTTEFPPRIIGELSNIVVFTAKFLLNKGFDVNVVAFDDWKSGFEAKWGIKVYYISNKVRSHVNPFTWASSLSCEYSRILSDLLWEQPGFDIIHAFEWSSALPLISLKEAVTIPYVQSFLSLEELRSHTSLSLLGQTIKWVESFSASLADSIVAHSETTYSMIRALYPWCISKLHLIDFNDMNAAEELIRIYKEVSEKHE
ncbi:MAG: glycosyltransferase [Thermoproteota archaeon]